MQANYFSEVVMPSRAIALRRRMCVSQGVAERSKVPFERPVFDDVEPKQTLLLQVVLLAD